jgi:hypothetical protein
MCLILLDVPEGNDAWPKDREKRLPWATPAQLTHKVNIDEHAKTPFCQGSRSSSWHRQKEDAMQSATHYIATG